MQWIIENWLVVMVAAGLLTMHLFDYSHGHKRVRKATVRIAHQKSPRNTKRPDRAMTDRSREDGNA